MAKGIKKIAPGRFLIRVNRLDPKTGRKVNRKLTIEGSADEAEQAYLKLRAEVRTTRSKPQRVRLAPYAHSWLARRVVKDSTRRTYGFAILNIIEMLGDYYIDAISPSMVQEYVNYALTKRAGETVKFELRILRTLAKDAQAEGLIERVFTDRVREPKGVRYTLENPNLFTPTQFAAVFEHLKVKWHGIVMFMVTTGLRWGEASALQWEDIREIDGETFAIIKYTNFRGRLTDPKTESSFRPVPILPEVLTLFGERKANGPVFPTKTGTLHVAGANLLSDLKAAEKAAGIPFKVTVHGLRRTFNNEARKITSREVLKSMTGHETDEMVEHYSVVATEEQTAASRSVFRSVLEASRRAAEKKTK